MREEEKAGPSVPVASGALPPHRVVMLVGPALQNQQGHHAPQEPGRRHPVVVAAAVTEERSRRFRRLRHVIQEHAGTDAAYGDRQHPEVAELEGKGWWGRDRRRAALPGGGPLALSLGRLRLLEAKANHQAFCFLKGVG